MFKRGRFVSGTQHADADFEVAFTAGRGIVGVAEQQPLVEDRVLRLRVDETHVANETSNFRVGPKRLGSRVVEDEDQIACIDIIGSFEQIFNSRRISH